MQTFYWANNTWVHDWVNGSNAPFYENVAGDIVIGANNQLFYRGGDGQMHTYYWLNNDWHHAWVGNQAVSAASGSIEVGQSNQLFFRGKDNKMHTYYWANNN